MLLRSHEASAWIADGMGEGEREEMGGWRHRSRAEEREYTAEGVAGNYHC